MNEILEPEVQLLAITPDAEKLIEEAGRTCYLSLDRITEGSSESFIQRSIRRGHHSILEHASASFRILGASGPLPTSLCVHRLASFSQQSQRYVDEKEFSYIIPPAFLETGGEALAVYREFMERSRQTYGKLRELGIKKQDARFVLANALESQIVFSANFRELRFIFELRLEKAAQWEIRRVTLNMLKIMQKQAPAVFGDFIIDETDWTATSEL